ncbi:GDP-mannose 4,6-dehydratase [candidate division KSB1 bacterium]|nr:GDP-mannose 4,6-dehydratase [candidate division KSB1 bacterium]
MKTALITGAAGFLGSHLCDYLLSKGFKVIGMDNLLTGKIDHIAHLIENENFKFIKHDVTEYIYIPGEVDYILHFASPASPIDYLEYPIQTLKVNALGTHKALGLAKEKKARFLLASTSEIYGDPLVHPQTEDYWGNVNPTGPRGVYDESKRYAEAITLAYHRTHGVDTRIARIFNSILADETIIVFNDEQCHLKSVEEYAKEVANPKIWRPRTVRVPAFDPQTGRISLHEASALFSHPGNSKDAYEVTTRYGRKIRVTGDHSLFRRTRDGKPEAEPVRHLRVGDYIAIPSKLPVVEKDLKYINVTEYLIKNTPEKELWEYALTLPELGPLISNYRAEIERLLRQSDHFHGVRKNNSAGCAYRKYLHGSFLPLYVFKKLQNIPLPRKGKLRMYKAGARVWIHNEIKITPDVLWLLGLFVAEGTVYSSDEHGTHFLTLSSDTDYLKRAQRILQAIFGVKVGFIKPSLNRSPSIYAHSKLLCLVFKRLFGLAHSSKTKQIPPWVFQLPLSRLKYFLEGYRQGDGTHSGAKMGNELCFNTVSDKLATDLTLLLLRFGIIASVGCYKTTFRQRYGERRFPFYRITICQLSNFDILQWDKGVHQTLNATSMGDLVWVQIRSINKCKSTKLVYDFSVPEVENFVAGNGVCAKNTYGPRMRAYDGRAVPTFINQVLDNKPITVFGDGSQTRSFCYVDDLVDGIYRLLTSEENDPVNLGNPQEMNILELAEKITEIVRRPVWVGNEKKIIFRPLPQDDPKIRQPDISRAKEILNWEPKTDLEKGLRATIDWFMKNRKEQNRK